ncbi:MAG: alpha-galactosidase [Clostridia bacterium]|nr:alpha-galactosidase [Clostridia bacterium]
MTIYKNELYSLSVQSDAFTYERHGVGSMSFSLPTLEINGERIALRAHRTDKPDTRVLRSGAKEITLRAYDERGYMLSLSFRVCDGNEIIKYSFSVKSEQAARLTKANGEYVEYLSVAKYTSLTEVRFAEYNHFVHSFVPSENAVDPRLYGTDHSIMGPMVLDKDESRTLLLAYEHGSQHPDKYLAFFPESTSLSVRAVKGNYYEGRWIDSEPFDSIVFHIGVFAPNDDPAVSYRTFQLKYATNNLASREPYIFYNTWCMQERDRWYNGHKYLDTMNEERILREIDTAHRIGVDVFVIDTGWYALTGDWKVNPKKFPNGFGRIHARLNEYGMKLGLWFNPKAVVLQSDVLQGYEDWIMQTKGQNNAPYEVWETPESYDMCLVSRYWERFADRLIELVEELGVTYFKWDAIGQYGCDSDKHFHGGSENTREERADCYAFSIGLYMAKIIDRLCEACPDAIVDFDITEPGRYTGLGFLSSGKYFLINNGPYYRCYNIPTEESVRGWNNIFVYPGEARTWICRTPLSYDKWIPSVLFLTHYLPDGGRDSQIINIASLILGQNGIWADLDSVSEEGVQLFGEQLVLYKRVKHDITEAYPVTVGTPGRGFEVHEKISERGKGAICLFADGAGDYEYLTRSKPSGDIRTLGDVTVERTKDGYLAIRTRSTAIVWSV